MWIWHYFQKWLNQKRLQQQARQWLNANPGPALPTRLMFTLNRQAKLGHPSYLIYRLKTNLIRHLYETGCCTELRKKHQIKLCWSCKGTGTYYRPGDCHECGGDGVCSYHTLYWFRFRVGGHSYNWHQPARLVDFPVKLTIKNAGRYNESHLSISEREAAGLIDLYVITVFEYLKRVDRLAYTVSGYDYERIEPYTDTIKLPLSFGDVIRYGLTGPIRMAIQRRRWAISREYKNIRGNARRLVHFLRMGEFPATPVSELSDEEIPF